MNAPRLLHPTAAMRRLARCRRGATIAEFAIILPLFIMMLMFLFDTGYYIFASSVLGGEVNAVGRNSTLETATDANRANLDTNLETQVKRLVRNGTLSFKRTAYKSYGRAQAKAESFNDANNNGVCDNGEAFDDANRNGTRDLDSGVDSGGGARDVVIYTATLTYTRIFPVASLLGWSKDVSMSASTILRNQPFDKQAEPLIGHCT